MYKAIVVTSGHFCIIFPLCVSHEIHFLFSQLNVKDAWVFEGSLSKGLKTKRVGTNESDILSF